MVLVKGAVPGAKNSFIRLTDALEKAVPAQAPFPTAEIKAKEEAKQDKPKAEELSAEEAQAAGDAEEANPAVTENAAPAEEVKAETPAEEAKKEKGE